jgi:hypothetical protein
MNTLQVTAKISKAGAITQHDKHLLCLAIIKQVMAMQIKERTYVPQVSQQGQVQSTKDSGIAALKCSNFLTQQEALV